MFLVGKGGLERGSKHTIKNNPRNNIITITQCLQRTTIRTTTYISPHSLTQNSPRVRNHDQFLTYVQLSSTARTPLLTLWTTSSCRTCHQVSPLLRHLVEDQGVGEAEGGVSYCEVEYDAPDVMRAGLGITYLINHVPTLLSFDAGEAQAETRVSDGNKLRDRHFLEEWIRTEARRHGGRGGGGGGGLGSSLFGGLFGSFNNKH